MERAEALHELRCFIGQLTEGCQEALETLIPELRESEDERIRKWIYNLVSYLDPQDDDAEKELDEMKPLALAWLEKHKEASKAIEAIERIDKYIDEHVANAHDMKDSDPDKKYYLGWDAALGKMAGILLDVYSGEKQKDHFRDDTKMVEQKPAEVDESTKRLNDNWMKQHFDDYEEQKPAEWSEEKEKAVDNYADEIIKWEDAHKDWDSQVIRATAYHFFNLQPKQEWSEEDEKKIHFLSRLIELQVKDDKYCFGDGSLISKQEAIEMLNSLRPSWRPSEEQMNALLGAEGILRSLQYDGRAKILASLYEQLKQL